MGCEAEPHATSVSSRWIREVLSTQLYDTVIREPLVTLRRDKLTLTVHISYDVTNRLPI